MPNADVSSVPGADLGELSREWTRVSRALCAALWTGAGAAAREARETTYERLSAVACPDGCCTVDAQTVLKSSSTARVAKLVSSSFSSTRQAWSGHISSHVERFRASSRQLAASAGIGPLPELLLSSIPCTRYFKAADPYMRSLLQTVAVKFQNFQNIAKKTQLAPVTYGRDDLALQWPAPLEFGHLYLQGVATTAFSSRRLVKVADKSAKLWRQFRVHSGHIVSSRGTRRIVSRIAGGCQLLAELCAVRPASGTCGSRNGTYIAKFLLETGNPGNDGIDCSMKEIRSKMIHFYLNTRTSVQQILPEILEARFRVLDPKGLIVDNTVIPRVRLAFSHYQKSCQDAICPWWHVAVAQCAAIWTEKIQPNSSIAHSYATAKVRAGILVAVHSIKGAGKFFYKNCLPVLWHLTYKLGTTISMCLRTMLFTAIKPGSLKLFATLKRLHAWTGDAACVLRGALVTVGARSLLRATESLRYYGVDPLLESIAPVLDNGMLVIRLAWERMYLVVQNMLYFLRITIILISGGAFLFLSSMLFATLVSIGRMSCGAAETWKNAWQYLTSMFICWRGCESTLARAPRERNTSIPVKKAFADSQSGQPLEPGADMLSSTVSEKKLISPSVECDSHDRNSSGRSRPAVHRKRLIPIPSLAKAESIQKAHVRAASKVKHSSSVVAEGTGLVELTSSLNAEGNDRPCLQFYLPLPGREDENATGFGPVEGSVRSEREYRYPLDLRACTTFPDEHASSGKEPDGRRGASARLRTRGIAIPDGSCKVSSTAGQYHPDACATRRPAERRPELCRQFGNTSFCADISGDSAAMGAEYFDDIAKLPAAIANESTRGSCMSSFQLPEVENKVCSLPSQGVCQKPGTLPVATRTSRDRSSKVLPPTIPDQSPAASSAVVIPASKYQTLSAPALAEYVDCHQDIPVAICAKNVDEVDDVVFVKGSIRGHGGLRMVYGSQTAANRNDITQRTNPASSRRSKLPKPTRRAGMVTKGRQLRNSALSHRASSSAIVIDD
jgi:hypothetical protein